MSVIEEDEFSGRCWNCDIFMWEVCRYNLVTKALTAGPEVRVYACGRCKEQIPVYAYGARKWIEKTDRRGL